MDEGDKVYMTTIFKSRSASAEVRRFKRKVTKAKRTKQKKQTTERKVVDFTLNDSQLSFSGGLTLETTFGKVTFTSIFTAVHQLLNEKNIIASVRDQALYYVAKNDKHTFVLTYLPKHSLIGVKIDGKAYSFVTSKPKFIYVLMSYALEPLKTLIPKYLDDIVELWDLALSEIAETDYIRFATEDGFDLEFVDEFIDKAVKLYEKFKQELTDKIDTSGFSRVNIEPLITFELEDHIKLAMVSNFFKVLAPIFHALPYRATCTITEALFKRIEPDLFSKLVQYVDRRMKTIISGVERIQFWTWLKQFADIESIAIELLHLQICDFLVHALEVRSYPAYLVSLTEKALNLYFMVNIQESIQYFENLGFITASPHKKYNALLFDRDVKEFVVPFVAEKLSSLLDSYSNMVANLPRMQHIALIIAPYLYKVGYNYSQYTLAKEKVPVALFLAALLKKFNFHYLPLLLLSYRESGYPPEKISSWKVFTNLPKIDDSVLDTWLRHSIPTIRLLMSGTFVHIPTGKKFKIEAKHISAIGQELARFVQLLSNAKRLQFGIKLMESSVQ